MCFFDLVTIVKMFVFPPHHIYFYVLMFHSTNFAPLSHLTFLSKIYFMHDKKTPMEYFLKYSLYSILYDLAVDDFFQSVLGYVSYSL